MVVVVFSKGIADPAALLAALKTCGTAGRQAALDALKRPGEANDCHADRHCTGRDRNDQAEQCLANSGDPRITWLRFRGHCPCCILLHSSGADQGSWNTPT